MKPKSIWKDVAASATTIEQKLAAYRMLLIHAVYFVAATFRGQTSNGNQLR